MSNSTFSEVDWNPVLCRMKTMPGQSLPTYPGNLKTALFEYAGVSNHPRSESVYQMAQDIARLTTYCDPEIAYWFSRLVPLIKP